MSIINNSHAIGVDTRNLVLKTRGSLHVKVGDRYYEIDFRNLNKDEDDETKREEFIITVDGKESVKQIEYPGDNKLIVGLDGSIFVTKNNSIIDVTPKSQNIIPETNLNVDEFNIEKLRSVLIEDKLYNTDMTLDFINSNIKVNTLEVLDSVTFPEKVPINKGVGSNVYFGPEISISSFNEIKQSEFDDSGNYIDVQIDNIIRYQSQYIHYLYNIGYLSNLKTIETWLSIFFNTHIDGEVTKIDGLKDFSSDEFKTQANEILHSSQGENDEALSETITIDKYKVAYEFMPISDNSHTGDIVRFNTLNTVDYKLFKPGLIVTNDDDTFIGRIITVQSNCIIVQFVSPSGNSVGDTKKLIVKSDKVFVKDGVFNLIKENNGGVVNEQTTDYSNKDFIELNSNAVTSLILKSGVLVKSTVVVSINITINSYEQLLTFEEGLYIVYINDNIITNTKLF